MGDLGLEHEKGRPSPQAKGRKASLTRDETGRIRKIPPGIPSHTQLSSIVKEQNDNKLLKVLFFRTDYLARDQFRQDGKKVMTGAVGHKRVPKDFIESQIIPYPKSIPEQQRIVAILDEAFAAIATAKENAEKNLQNAHELFESYLQSVFANPGDGWEVKKLGDKNFLKIIDGDRGKNYPKKNDFLEEGYCLFMNTKNVRPDGFDFEATMFINEKKDKALGHGKLRRNDVVMTTRGTIGNLGIFNDAVDYDNIRINSGMLIFRPNLEVIIPEYLFEILRSGIIKAQIAKHVSGAAQPQL